MIKSKVAAFAFLTTYQTYYSVFGIDCSDIDTAVTVDPIGVRHENLDRIHGGEKHYGNKTQKV